MKHLDLKGIGTITLAGDTQLTRQGQHLQLRSGFFTIHPVASLVLHTPHGEIGLRNTPALGVITAKELWIRPLEQGCVTVWNKQGQSLTINNPELGLRITVGGSHTFVPRQAFPTYRTVITPVAFYQVPGVPSAMLDTAQAKPLKKQTSHPFQGRPTVSAQWRRPCLYTLLHRETFGDPLSIRDMPLGFERPDFSLDMDELKLTNILTTTRNNNYV